MLIGSHAALAAVSPAFAQWRDKFRARALAKGISEATYARVTSVMDELGYVPNILAQRLARGRANVIGLLCHFKSYRDHLFTAWS